MPEPTLASAAPAAQSSGPSPATADSLPASPPAGSDPQEQAPSLFERIFGRHAKDAPDTDTASGDREPVKEEPTSLATKPLGELTDAELDQLVRDDPRVQRRVQAETDRRERVRADRQKAEERKRLRQEDPWAYAQQDDQEEARQNEAAAFVERIAGIAGHFDEGVLKPVIDMLPEAERARLLADEKLGAGIDGRGALLQETVHVLLKQAREEGRKEAEQSLRKNEPFRKQILAQLRGESEEPENVPAATGTPGGRDMNDWMRVGVGKSRANGTH